MRNLEESNIELGRVIGKPRTALDVGCGEGVNGEAAKQKGAKVTGVEGSTQAAGAAKQRLDEVIEVDPDTDEAKVRLAGRTFDVLLFGADVLAKTKNARALVERFLPLLEDGGHAIFSKKAATRLAEDAGLEVLHVDGQHVVARKRPERKKLSLTVGMISMNEAGAVGKVIDDIKAQVPEAEILLVDSSKDETPQIAESKGARVVRQFPPRGYGPAMHRLLYETTTDVIVTMDCDGTYPADRIAQLHQLVEDGADLVNATRTRRRPKAMPFPNYIANRVFAGAAFALHGLPTTDVHSGMRAYRTSMLRGLNVDPQGPALPVDLYVVPARLGYRIVEVEIPYFERVGATTLHRFDSTLWTFKRLLRARSGARVKSGRVENL